MSSDSASQSNTTSTQSQERVQSQEETIFKWAERMRLKKQQRQTKEKKEKRVRIRKEDSLFFARKYKEHKKSWNHFFTDSDVTAKLEVGPHEEDQVKQHVNYLKRKIVQKVPSRGSYHREKIVDGLADRMELSTPVDDEPLVISDEESAGGADSLSEERLVILDDLEKEMLEETVISSSQASEPGAFKKWSQEQKTQKQVSGSRIADKAAEKQELVSIMRDQQEQQCQSTQLRVTTNLLMLKMMEKAMGMLEQKEEKEPKIAEGEDPALGDRVAAMEAKLDKILAALDSI